MLPLRMLFTFLVFLCLLSFSHAQSIGINNNEAPPNENAILDIHSVEKGILIPRMTTVERISFAASLTDSEIGMLVFDTDQGHFYFWSQGAFRRINLSTRILDLDEDTEIRVEDTPDDDIIRFYTSGAERWRIDSLRLEPINDHGLIFIGKEAGRRNGTRINNIAIGDSSLFNNGHEVSGASAGNNNIAIGKLSLQNNITGFENVSVGSYSLNTNVDGSGNTALGFRSLSGNSEGNGNTAIGHQTLQLNRTGDYNVGLGVNALNRNLTGSSNVAIGVGSIYNNSNGSYNVAIGMHTLSSSPGVSKSVAIGSNAARFNKVSEVIAIGDSTLMRNGVGASFPYQGDRLVAIGARALNRNTLGYYNVGLGYEALTDNTTGSNNTALGTNALGENTTGNGNTSIGSLSMTDNETGNYNSAMGFDALAKNESGSNNTAIGAYSMINNQTGAYNTALGSRALSFSNGSRNVAIGSNAARYTTSGDGNIAIGHAALADNSIQGGNVAIGDSALYDYNASPTLFTGQVAIGQRSQRNLNSGSRNNAVGAYTLYSNTSGVNNSAFGSSALYSCRGDNNTALGNGALSFSEGGDENTAVGSFALYNNTSRNRRTAVGFSANSIGNNGNNTGIGNDADCTAAHQVRLGNSLVTSIGGYANWTNISDGSFKKDIKEDVVGLEFIKQLRPVTYKLNLQAVYNFYESKYGENKRRRYEEPSEAESMIRSGFIAQEVESLAKSLGYEFSGVDAPKNKKDYYGLRYAEFVVPLVKAMQEQQDMIEEQDQLILDLEKRLSRLERLLLNDKVKRAH